MWPEVKWFLKDTTINPEDIPDILCRLFKIKLDAIIKDLKEKSVLGKVQAGMLFIFTIITIYSYFNYIINNSNFHIF
jgi:hypothetical protein